MPDRLLILAAVNLALAAAILPPLALRRVMVGCQVAVAAVPALWSALLVAAYATFRATRPPELAVPRTGFLLGALDQGDFAAQAWDTRLGAAIALGGWLTLATLLAVGALWLGCAVAAWRQRRVTERSASA